MDDQPARQLDSGLPDLSAMTLEELLETDHAVFGDVLQRLRAQLDSATAVVAGFQSAV